MWLLARWWITAAAFVALAGFVQAGLEREVTYQDGLVALCMATVFLIESIRQRQTLMILGSVGGIASSYLWLANGAEASPFDIQLLAILGLVFVLALLGAFWLMLPFIRSNETRGGLVMIVVFLLLALAVWATSKFLLA